MTCQPAIPVIGSRYRARIAPFIIELGFESPTRLAIKVEHGAGIFPDGHEETVSATMVEVRPNLYLTSWKEPSGAAFSHIHDFERGEVIANVTLRDGSLINTRGPLERIDGPPLPEPTLSPEANKAIVLRAMKELFEDRDVTALDRYWKESYVQHHHSIESGVDSVRSAFSRLQGISWTPHRAVAEGDLVMVHSRVLGWGPAPMVNVDIFRLEGGRIAEHWDVIQEEVPPERTSSGNPMV
jgi:predicted SnoaL-like aldol condensation-catalyzing enzyme